jgi:hypothetical protein
VIAARTDGVGFVAGVSDIRSLALQAIESGRSLAAMVESLGIAGPADVEAEFAAGNLTTPIDHPDPAHLILTGTGLTHLGSA